ncbi:MAG: HupE/UreJ family protein [Dehalococcoidia bacterium]
MRRVVSAILALLVLVPTIAIAHDVDVTSIARLFIDQIGERRYTVSVVDTKVPPLVTATGVLPAHCAVIPAAEAGVRIVTGFAFECQQPLTIDDKLILPWSLAGVVVLARWSDGTAASALFRGDGRQVLVSLADLRADSGSTARLARRYLVLGVEHILSGVDHLLFVLGLLLLLRGGWPLIQTITAFTVAHSLTLGAAVLGWVPVDSAPVEAGIALSIVLLAREIVVGHRGHVHLVHRQPWLVAFMFGLLHGLGFAGALGNIGLRSADVPMALLSFNVGVEIGQLLFVATLLALAALLRRANGKLLPRLEPALGYALGGFSVFWLFDRLPSVWGA